MKELIWIGGDTFEIYIRNQPSKKHKVTWDDIANFVQLELDCVNLIATDEETEAWHRAHNELQKQFGIRADGFYGWIYSINSNTMDSILTMAHEREKQKQKEKEKQKGSESIEWLYMENADYLNEEYE